MENVFDVVASSYIRDDEHWGSDLDILKATFDLTLIRGHKIDYLDVGCGPGFHIVTMQRLYPEALVLGVDASKEMCDVALEHGAEALMLGTSVINDDVINLNESAHRHNVASFLNNGLGNVTCEREEPGKARRFVISKLHRLLRPDGLLIVSVYNRSKLTSNYGRKLRVLSKSQPEEGELFVEYRTNSGSSVEYYSHWFTKNELIILLQGNGFEVDFLEERMARIVVRARAV